jgi:hypothetical protein
MKIINGRKGISRDQQRQHSDASCLAARGDAGVERAEIDDGLHPDARPQN